MDHVAQRGSGEERSRSRRAFLRVRGPLRVRHRTLAPGEAEALRFEIETAGRPAAAGLDPRQVAWLERLEAKLDRILAHLEPSPGIPLRALPHRDVEISGAGLRMTTSDRPPVGSQILVEILLPGASLPLRAVGVVRRHVEPEAPGEEPGLAVAFRAIHEGDRQAIVRFALEAERARARARADGAGTAS